MVFLGFAYGAIVGTLCRAVLNWAMKKLVFVSVWICGIILIWDVRKWVDNESSARMRLLPALQPAMP